MIVWRAGAGPAFLLAALTSTALAQLPDSAAVSRGRKAFVSACGFCHGEDATGNRGPDLVRSPLVNHDVSGNLIGPVIKGGRPDKGMPAFPMSDAQIADIVAFLHAQVLVALHSAHVPGDYPLEKLLTGNAQAGKQYFYGAGGCSACHSPTGDLAGIAEKYKPIDLQSKMLYPAARGSRDGTVTVTLPSGKKIQGRLAHLDEFDVALWDSGGWYRSWPRREVRVDVHDPLEAHQKLLGKITNAEMHNLFAYLETLK
ncbi:MAG TPA: c-type cytochrome [Bryobacteraceae bacterium]|nr:c-type cytochrome [Bryobacteraceae bacterium]